MVFNVYVNDTVPLM